jgi:hypothetical protein
MWLDQPAIDGIRGTTGQKKRVTQIEETPHVRGGLELPNRKARRSGILTE